MPPWPSWWRGRATIAAFAAAAVEFCAETRTIPTRANGQVALAYHLDAESGQFTPVALDVLTLEGSRIKEITALVTPEVFSRFELPAELAPLARRRRAAGYAASS
jgi:RNA polymerase sigma-70 factor (ECF subfamily)